MAGASCDGEKFAGGRLLFRQRLTLRDQLAKGVQQKVVEVSIASGDRMTAKLIDALGMNPCS